MIPDFFFLDGVRWTVRWRDPTDPTWQRQKAWGMTIWSEEPEIHLCSSMHADPTKKREVWLHELMHACFPDMKKVDAKLEEKIVHKLADKLSGILNQTGW